MPRIHWSPPGSTFQGRHRIFGYNGSNPNVLANLLRYLLYLNTEWNQRIFTPPRKCSCKNALVSMYPKTKWIEHVFTPTITFVAQNVTTLRWSHMQLSAIWNMQYDATCSCEQVRVKWGKEVDASLEISTHTWLRTPLLCEAELRFTTMCHCIHEKWL